MGLRGPRPLSSQELKARGSKIWQQRAEQEKAASQAPADVDCDDLPAPAWLL